MAYLLRNNALNPLYLLKIYLGNLMLKELKLIRFLTMSVVKKTFHIANLEMNPVIWKLTFLININMSLLPVITLHIHMRIIIFFFLVCQSFYIQRMVPFDNIRAITNLYTIHLDKLLSMIITLALKQIDKLSIFRISLNTIIYIYIY